MTRVFPAWTRLALAGLLCVNAAALAFGSEPTPAERSDRIAKAWRQLAADEEKLLELQGILGKPSSEMNLAFLEFVQLAGRVETLSRQLEESKKANKPDVAAQESELKPLQEQLDLARERFTLAHEERQLLRQQISSVSSKVRKQREEFDTLMGYSEIERVARVNHAIELSKRELQDLEAQLKSATTRFLERTTALRELEAERNTLRDELAVLRNGKDPHKSAVVGGRLVQLEPRCQQAKTDVMTAEWECIAARRRIAVLERRIATDAATVKAIEERWANRRLAAADKPPPDPNQKPGETGGSKPAESGGSSKDSKTEPGAVPLPPLMATVGSNPGAAEHTDAKVQQAEEDAKSKEDAAQRATEQAEAITAQVNKLRELIEKERTLRGNAQKQIANAQETKKVLEEQLAKKGAPELELKEIRDRLKELDRRIRDNQAGLARADEKLQEMHLELTDLQVKQFAAQTEADRLRREADSAHGTVADLQNPFAPQNILRWLTRHGPPIAVIILVMLLLRWGVRLASRRIVGLVAKRDGRGTAEDRENRVRTLVGVFQNFSSLVILIGGTLMILREVGVDIFVLLGGAAILGVAVAFGAQNLIRDYFTGFMILLENQFMIGDVIRIGGQAGLVERITMRVTVLRDIDGTVHFIPNGQIATVSNLTQEWSRALFDVEIAYKEDVDRVIQLLRDLARELRAEPNYRFAILEDPEMLGVDAFRESGVTIRFYIKTLPRKQWLVKRELLRRIKKKFDELGIEIPYPHRTIYHRTLPPDAPAEQREWRHTA